MRMRYVVGFLIISHTCLDVLGYFVQSEFSQGTGGLCFFSLRTFMKIWFVSSRLCLVIPHVCKKNDTQRAVFASKNSLHEPQHTVVGVIRSNI